MKSHTVSFCFLGFENEFHNSAQKISLIDKNGDNFRQKVGYKSLVFQINSNKYYTFS